jgi:hypothetical protein
MTLLDWLEQTPNAHLIGECFEVQSDLEGATEALQDRAHLLPMSDSTLLNVGLGISLNGECAVVEWPSSDLSNISAWLQTIPESGIGSMIIRIHADTGVDWSGLVHPAVEVWSIATNAQRSDVLQRALTERCILILLENTASMAWHRLENRACSNSVSRHGELPAHCVLVSANLHSAQTQNAIDALREEGVSILWHELHNISKLDQATLQNIFDVGRVVCVGLPKSWMSSVISKAFWRLENEPIFCEALEANIVQAVYTALES